MLDLVKKVVDHVFCQLHLTISHKSHLSKITVPTIHLVESTTRYDIWVRQIKEPMLSNLTRIVPQLSQRNLRKLFPGHLRLQRLFDLLDVFALRNINRPATISHCFEFWIGSRLCQLRVRAFQRVPTLFDVSLQRLQLSRGGLFRRIGEYECWEDQ